MKIVVVFFLFFVSLNATTLSVLQNINQTNNKIVSKFQDHLINQNKIFKSKFQSNVTLAAISFYYNTQMRLEAYNNK